uniref:Uncharacterized protein n=1 Tax=Chromera velia CCMP2878 TaxID=1169474 RepID=A0A0G4FVD4_9ALVE|eukprot:Cvel_480.t1-p1 / transcript=Cvel_480.t1 / gene=Cvel_480 / organism=Chromera_velia_CCMP2878 / gene_product=hypothetical protein / transcript_product=hypothetical protein / location=Cvel_scaffold15:77575-79162(-) / protein_length=303 / sequence_SO=supercontig / SO=protein_coding / is_pseudo=false
MGLHMLTVAARSRAAAKKRSDNRARHRRRENMKKELAKKLEAARLRKTRAKVKEAETELRKFSDRELEKLQDFEESIDKKVETEFWHLDQDEQIRILSAFGKTPSPDLPAFLEKLRSHLFVPIENEDEAIKTARLIMTSDCIAKMVEKKTISALAGACETAGGLLSLIDDAISVWTDGDTEAQKETTGAGRKSGILSGFRLGYNDWPKANAYLAALGESAAIHALISGKQLRQQLVEYGRVLKATCEGKDAKEVEKICATVNGKVRERFSFLGVSMRKLRKREGQGRGGGGRGRKGHRERGRE